MGAKVPPRTKSSAGRAHLLILETVARPGVVHPGAVLADILRELAVTQGQAAESIGVSDAYISDVIRGKRGVSTRLALKLERICGEGSAWGLCILQLRHDLEASREELQR